MRLKFVSFFPLLFTQIYLIATLLLFQFGPISYRLPHPYIFWTLIFCYHLAFILGYLAAVLYTRRELSNTPLSIKLERPKLSFFYLVLSLAFIASLFSFKGDFSGFEILNPYYWLESAFYGIINPGDAYNAKMDRVNSTTEGNKLLNIFLFLIAFSKIILLPLTVFYWTQLSLSLRLISVYVALMPLMASLSQGTNKGVFDFIILFGSALTIASLRRKYTTGDYGLKRHKVFGVFLIAAFLGALFFFGSAMSSRSGDLRYIETQDPLNNISIDSEVVLRGTDSFVYFTYSWLSSYLVQGYYGFGLSITQDFDTTFGVGNSPFLMRNVENILNIDLRSRTFQNKLDPWWGESSQWHSFYSYFANDFHFVGVAFVCFGLSFIMGRVWLSFLETGNFFAGSLMSILSILIIFIPANNQIFGFLDGLSAFTFASLFWFLSLTRVRLFRRLRKCLF